MKVGDRIRVCHNQEIAAAIKGGFVARAPGNPRRVIKLDSRNRPVVAKAHSWERYEFTVRSWVRA